MMNLIYFLGCEELSEKTSWLDRSTFGTNSILQGAYHYCVVNCRDNAYIAKIRKDSTSPKYKNKNVSYVANNERERFSQVSPVFSNMNQIMWGSFLSNHSLLRW